jgi:arginyl-tRNA--protein-N-Asp/Glu arginylyltransferase
MKLKLHEIVGLHYELNGITKQKNDGAQEVVSQGLLKQKASLKVKVYLQRLNKVVAEEVKLYEDNRLELYKKYGEEADGQITLKKENFDDFNKDHEELLTAEKEVDVKMLWSTDLTVENLAAIETDEVYPIFLKLIDENK